MNWDFGRVYTFSELDPNYSEYVRSYYRLTSRESQSFSWSKWCSYYQLTQLSNINATPLSPPLQSETWFHCSSTVSCGSPFSQPITSQFPYLRYSQQMKWTQISSLSLCLTALTIPYTDAPLVSKTGVPHGIPPVYPHQPPHRDTKTDPSHLLDISL